MQGPFAVSGLLAMLAALPALPGQQTARALDRAIARMHAAITADLDIWTDHSTFENAWVGRTKNFTVRTTVSYGLARDIAVGLETMLGHFQRVLGTDFVPSAPLPVYVFPNRAEYNAFGEQHGEHHSSFYGSFHAPGHPEQPVAAEWNENGTLMRMQITHSVVHQYLRAAYPATATSRPVWIEEGLAAYFTHYWNPEWTLTEYLRAKEENRLVPLSTALRDNIAVYGARTDERMLQLAIFFDYLLRLREDTRSAPDENGRMRGPFRDYLIAVLEGRDPADEPFAALLADPARLQREFEAFDFGR